MDTDIQHYITHTAAQPWQPLVEKAVHYTGVYVKSLRFDPLQHRSPSILLRFDAGAAYPYHNHPGGEELYVISGEVDIAGAHLVSGDYLYTPPGFKHLVSSGPGCILLLIVPEEVELINS
ncbi:hypothetical protein GCM10027566_03070 [Arachidicoccus ginsenosidivorans]|uniref:Cupin domain-containing protein n=1 Tax=Arachidicoccus ginsenosidivorans TaxID=496057 RepID=A0A5B8VLJ5_9BACT|nr:cupin domain-containing protein [Arachidicoccus ginsenosidivorans]QEC72464.1 cupin domain-containing protein [Arachidicoccus ginsenosidivorans]